MRAAAPKMSLARLGAFDSVGWMGASELMWLLLVSGEAGGDAGVDPEMGVGVGPEGEPGVDVEAGVGVDPEGGAGTWTAGIAALSWAAG